MCGGVRCVAVPVACIRSVGESAAGAGHGVGLCDRVSATGLEHGVTT